MPLNRHHRRQRFAGRPAPTGERRTSLVFVGACLQANSAAEQASPQAKIRRQAGSYRGSNGLVFVGACLQANRAAEQASPQAKIRRQAGSYRGIDRRALSLWELACKRIMPLNRHHRRQRFAGRPAPTGERRTCLVFVGACLQANSAAEQVSPQAKIRRQAAPTGERRTSLVFVGACLQANSAAEQASPQAKIRRQVSSYRGKMDGLCL